MSALGQKQTYVPQKGMSALPLKADMCGAQAHVCFGPKADIRASRIWRVFTASSGSFNPRVDFAAKHPKVDWFGKKRLGATIQRLALGLCVAISGDHDHRDVRSKLFGFWQQFKAAHSWHVDVRQN